MRAFDRRPSGPVVIGREPAAQQIHHHGDGDHQEAVPDLVNLRPSTARTTSPESSSSSGDHGQPGREGENEGILAVDDDLILWDWPEEQYSNWFHDGME